MAQTIDAWAELLDRSWERIGILSADARTFDRAVVNRIANLWDNNTRAFVHVACIRGAHRREAAARRCVDWMAKFEPERYSWALEDVWHPEGWPPPAVDDGPHRDYAGHVRPSLQAFSASTHAELAVDYDLASAQVGGLTVQRTGGELACTVNVLVARRFANQQEEPAELHLEFTGVEALRFHQNDRTGIRIEWSEGRPALVIGKDGVIRAAAGNVGIWDVAWHLSAAGQALDAILPAGVPVVESGWSRKNRPRLGRRGTPKAARDAATFLRDAMILVRGVGSLSLAETMPVHEYAQAFAGSGSAIVSAGTSFRRETAFRHLIDRWREAGGDLLEPFPARCRRGAASATVQRCAGRAVPVAGRAVLRRQRHVLRQRSAGRGPARRTGRSVDAEAGANRGPDSLRDTARSLRLHLRRGPPGGLADARPRLSAALDSLPA